jgi:hypothetical protein
MAESNADKVKRVLRDNANNRDAGGRIRSHADEKAAHLEKLESNRGKGKN